MEEGGDQGRGLSLEDLERGLPFFAAVGADQVEVMPVGGDFGPEVGGAGEGLPIKEFVLDEAVNGFDIALPSVALWGYVTVVGAQSANG